MFILAIIKTDIYKTQGNIKLYIDKSALYLAIIHKSCQSKRYWNDPQKTFGDNADGIETPIKETFLLNKYFYIYKILDFASEVSFFKLFTPLFSPGIGAH